MREIIESLTRCLDHDISCVVATIIEVEGSAYQHEGARCLIQESGEITGILSGGCAEQELFKHAQSLLKSGAFQTIELDFREDDDLFGYGSGCDGKLTIWLEVFHPKNDPRKLQSMINELEHREATEQAYFSITVLDSANLTKIANGERRRVEITAPPFQLVRDRASLVKCVINQTMANVFVEPVYPRPRLLLVGTGPDAVLLSEWMKKLDWQVDLVFYEMERASKRYFPLADRIIHVPRGDFSRVSCFPHHLAVIMSHQFEIDLAAVKHFLPTPIRYIGLLASSSRKKRLLRILADDESFDELVVSEKLFSPVGLNLGAQLPEEITLSIAAELLAVFHGKTGGSLKGKGERNDLFKRKYEPRKKSK